EPLVLRLPLGFGLRHRDVRALPLLLDGMPSMQRELRLNVMLGQHVAGDPLSLHGGDLGACVQEYLRVTRADGDRAAELTADVFFHLMLGQRPLRLFGLCLAGQGDGYPPVIAVCHGTTLTHPKSNPAASAGTTELLCGGQPRGSHRMRFSHCRPGRRLPSALALGSGRPGPELAALHRLTGGGTGEPEYSRGQVTDRLEVLGLLGQRQGRLEMGERRFGIAEDGQRVTGEYPGPDVIGPAFEVLGDLRPRVVS